MQWAAEAFAWPDYTAEELYYLNKVLNEHDFLPLMVLHEAMISAKLVRHYKGALHSTRLAACVDMVPSPEMSVLGIVAEAVNAEVPLPLR